MNPAELKIASIQMISTPVVQENLDTALVKTGWVKGRDFSTKVYAGTPHEENAWAARLDDIFIWMLQRW